MELSEIIKGRRSIRQFQQGMDIDESTIRKILEAGILAPSAGNIQPWRYYVITSQKIKEALAEAALSQIFVSESSCVIVVCINTEEAFKRYGERGTHLYAIQDTAAAIQNMLLMIHSLGLGCCWIGAFREESTKEILNLDDHLRPVAILPIGYPAERPSKPPKKPLASVVEWIK